MSFTNSDTNAPYVKANSSVLCNNEISNSIIVIKLITLIMYIQHIFR